MPKLSKYDGTCVRITTREGEVYDGICEYNSPDYCAHEFGRDEECLQLVWYLFYKSDIKKIESLEAHTGPYGRFCDPFGKLEEDTAADGPDAVADYLFCEEPEHVLRMLRFLEHRLDTNGPRSDDPEDLIPAALKTLADTTDAPEIREHAGRVLEKLQ